MKYSHVLFDADETLFSFNAFEGLKVMFAHYGVEFTESDYHRQRATDNSLYRMG
jgi:putative hydrolase of the HAD superfamily/5'-nucleotidase